jgi:hypothetical protein
MGDEMRYLIVLLLLISNANASNHAVSDITYTFDSEDTTTQRILAGYSKDVDSWNFSGLLGTYKVDDNEGQRSFVETRGLFSTTFNAAMFLSGHISTLNGDTGSHINGSAYFVYDPVDSWRYELSYERTLLDTVNAVDSDINVDTASLSVDYNLNEEWTAVGGYAHQFYTDSNSRSIVFGKLIYSPRRISGLNIQGFVKYSDSEFNPSEYFSPNNQMRMLVGIGFATPFIGERFVFRTSLLTGRQTNKFTSNSATDAKIQINGSITNRFYMRLLYLYTNDNGEGFDYWYQSIHLNLKYSF